MISSIKIALVLLAVAVLCQCSDSPTVQTKPNHPPVLASINPQTVQEGFHIEFIVQATDSDGVVPTISATNLPTNASVADSGNGTMLFVFKPDFTQSGTYNVTFIASDGQLADSEVVTTTVIDAGNHPPILALIGPKSVLEGQVLAFDISASDSDGTIPVMTALDLPIHAVATDSGNGKLAFTFEPDLTQSGTYTVTFIASDGQLADSEVVTTTVVDAGNQPPGFAPIEPRSVLEAQNLAFIVSATDPEGSIPVMTAFDLPSNAAATDSADGRMLFVFDPDYTQSGIYTVTFVASDGNGADSESVNIEVLNVNRPPVLAHINDVEMFVDSTLSVLISATDPDGTTPSLGHVNAPENSVMTASDGTARFTFTPDSTQIGVNEPIFVASDGEMADSQVVTITVSVYEKSVGELLPMAIGNYWVYETSDQYQPVNWTLDSIHVQSSYQSDGLTKWVLSGNGLWYIGRDLSIRNDSIIDYWHTVAPPAVWPERTDTVPAGIFTSTFVDCISNNSIVMDCISFAKGIGVIRYKYSYATPRQPETHSFQARLVRYYVK